MFSAINEIQEIKQNRFENIPLVKHIDEVKQAEITGNQSLSAYVSDISGVLHDDGGAIYCRHGKLIPNLSYALNGYRYMTDGKGRIVTCEAKPKITPENLRDFGAQRQVGDIYRRPNDQGGHIISRDLNGFGGLGNLVAMDSKINQSDYKRMENEIKSLLNLRKTQK